MTCPDCHYLREERAGIHEFLGRATRAEAERLAASERCPAHQELKTQEMFATTARTQREHWKE